jgi:hypothetical protein
MSEARFSEVSALAALLAAVCMTTYPAAAQEDAASADDIAELKSEIEALRGSLPSQSHTMADVEFHFANLWFAGKNEDWPLATFYFNETRSHLNWAVRVRPVRRVSSGELDLRPMLAGIESSGLADLKTAIDNNDSAAFEAAYRGMMGQCYACHVAAEKPYLQPHIPESPPSAMVNRPLRAEADH